MIKNWLNGYCERCGDKSSPLSGSYFNNDMCCAKCITLEKNHKDYEEARRVEREEILKGNLAFEGSGLPEDLKVCK